MPSEVDAVLDSKRQDLFLLARQQAGTDVSYKDAKANPDIQTDAEIYAFTRKIEGEYTRKHSDARISAMVGIPTRFGSALKRNNSERKYIWHTLNQPVRNP